MHEHVTLALTVLGKVTFDATRVVPTTFSFPGSTEVTGIGFAEDTSSEANAAAGLKVLVRGSLLLDLNVLFRLNEDGLRDDFTPLFGFEYSF